MSTLNTRIHRTWDPVIPGLFTEHHVVVNYSHDAFGRRTGIAECVDEGCDFGLSRTEPLRCATCHQPVLEDESVDEDSSLVIVTFCPTCNVVGVTSEIGIGQ